jgi:hypothetical protein
MAARNIWLIARIKSGRERAMRKMVRDEQAGSGYWSQEAAAQVLGCGDSRLPFGFAGPAARSRLRLENNVWSLRVNLKDGQAERVT